MNFHELENFNLADAVKFHRRLNPVIWGRDEHLLPEVREKLLAIAADFQEFLGVDDLQVQDITISGSNAAYSYTPHSDIDLHLVVDMPEDPVYQELFAAKKYQYNTEHDIRIGGIPVELYVQPADQKHVSQGIYSIKHGDWKQVPQRRRARVDDSCVQHKAADLDARIHAAIHSGDADVINRLWDRIKAMRQAGLEQNGEFGCENIVFKLLRNQGCIGRLKDAKTVMRDRELSLEPRARKKVNYGMRDYWFPGTAYAGQDHPAGTESQPVNEGVDPDHLNKILRRFYLSCVKHLQLKKPPRLQIETTPEWSQQHGSFGQYDPDTNTLILATSGRHVLDILRTMAHEMTHRQQDERDPLPAEAGETGSPWEDEANAMAGRIMRNWAEEQPEMFDGVTLEESAQNHWSVPPVLYHATYRPLLRSIKQGGLGGPGSEKKKWEDSIHGAVYLALDPHVAESYAETSDSVPDEWLDEIVILKISTDGLNPGKFMLDRNVRDNAGDTVEYHGIIPLSNISLLKKNMSEASGYIPTKSQARDPRFVMALTKDVRPGAVGREANKLGLQTDSQGHPALLTAKLNRMLREFKEQDLFEIRMSPANLRQQAAKTGALAGMEFEMIVPNTGGDTEPSMAPDYDYDKRTRSLDRIRNFFDDGDYNSSRDVERVIGKLEEQYLEWQSEQIDRAWDIEGENTLMDYIKDNDIFDMDAARERATNEITADYGDDLAPEDFEKRVDALVQQKLYNFVSQQWKEQGSVYDQAREQYEEEQREDFDQEDWLREVYPRMTDIEANFALTWPHWIDENEGTGDQDIESVAEDFGNAVGKRVNWSSSYHGGRREPNAYVVEPDSSLEPDDDDDSGLEFVSPPMPIDEMIDQLNKVREWAGTYGCYTNKSTGLHINISVPGYSQDRLDYVKLALLLGDQYVLDQFGRSSNTYTKSALTQVQQNVKNNPDSAQQLLDKMRGHMGDLASKAIHSGQTAKYTSINTKTGYIEFRSPGGDWLDANFDKIENTLLRFTVALAAAIDPAAYREEYLKKLYRLLEPVTAEKSQDTIKYFADYVAGKTPRAALRSFVKQAQLERRIKRGDVGGEEFKWEVKRPGYMASIIVRAKTKEQAIDRALEPDGYPDWASARNQLVATPIGPADTSPVRARAGEPEPVGPGRSVVAYRSRDADRDDAALVAHQMRQANLRQRAAAATRNINRLSQTDFENRLGWPDQTGDANYEVVRRDTMTTVFVFIANTDQDALHKYEDWLAAAGQDPDTEDYGFRRIDGARMNFSAPVTPDQAQGGIVDVATDHVVNPLWQDQAQAPRTLTTPGQPQQQFTGNWLIQDQNGDVIHRFGGVGNVQSDANRAAIAWLRAHPGSMQSGVTVVPEMS